MLPGSRLGQRGGRANRAAPLPCWLGPCRVRCKHPRRDRGTESWDSTKTEKEQLEKEKGLVHTGLCLGLCNKAQNA